MSVKYNHSHWRPVKGKVNPPKRTHEELAEELGVPTGTLRLLAANHPEGYPDGLRASSKSKAYYVRKDFITWWLSLPEDVRAKAKAKHKE